MTLSGGSSGAGINLGFDSVTGTNVGTGSAGTAVMTVANSSVTLDSTGGQAFVNVGRFNNANATLNLNSGGILSATGDTLATLSVATNGNAATTGTANFNSGSTATFTNDGAATGGNTTGMFVGNTGTGTVNVNGGVVHFVSTNNSGFGALGYNSNNSSVGTGNLNISNGGLVDYNVGVAGGHFGVGREAGSTGALIVSSGGTLDLDGTTGQKLSFFVGDHASTAEGVVVITGANSKITGVSNATVGMNNNLTAGVGNGNLLVESGGLFDASTLLVGAGGFLLGSGGTVDADVTLATNGVIGDTSDLFNTMSIVGSLTVNGGQIEVDIGAEGVGGGKDLYTISGDLNLTGGVIRLDAVNGYQYAAGSQRMFANVGGFTNPSGGFSASNIIVTGQHADFGYIVGTLDGVTQSLGILALTSGATGGHAILDLGTAAAIGANFTYDTNTDTGIGEAGKFGNGGFFAKNIDEVLGTYRADVITITGNGGMNLYSNDGADTITGGDAIDYIDGGLGNDTLNGGGADDTMVGGGGTDTFNGGAGIDIMFGDAGNDTISGGDDIDGLLGFGGTNTLIGGLGDDIYYSQSATDIFIEGSALGDGNDIVVANYNITLATNVERVILQGAATAATGNDGNNLLFGREITSGAAVTLTGLAGDDILYGTDTGNDTLNGGSENDAMLGFGGTNTMDGGTGNDNYYSYSITDVIIESTSGVAGGTDKVITTHDIASLAANVENVEIIGAASQVTGNDEANELYGGGSGNGLVLDGAGGADILIGSAQGDLLSGGTGDDFLFGGAGEDGFRFLAAGSGADTITDFDSDATGGQDYIMLTGRGFSAASVGGVGAAIAITQAGAHTLITIGADTITLSNTLASNVTAADFLF